MFALAAFILAFICIIVLTFVTDTQIASFFYDSARVLIGISGAIVFILLPILAIIEVVSSNNETRWKILWIALNLVFSVFGLAAYILFARKNLKAD